MPTPARPRSSAPRQRPLPPPVGDRNDQPAAIRPAREPKLPGGEQTGFIVMVNPREGYGFIRPQSAGRAENRDVHFALRNVEGHKRVHPGQSVRYYLTRSEKGVTAIKVRPGSLLSVPYLKFLIAGLVSALALLAGLTIIVKQPQSFPLWLGLWVVAFSLATFGIYWYDKAQAQAGGLRVPEPVLHLLGALGGTPGAFAAMRHLPHKTKKPQFQAIFWLIVAAQIGLLAWYFFLRR
jgi:uncharacterized membrane protein YsdA (DUF1294 family)/cold shock CspA family protein